MGAAAVMRDLSGAEGGRHVSGFPWGKPHEWTRKCVLSTHLGCFPGDVTSSPFQVAENTLATWIPWMFEQVLPSKG